LTLLAKMPKWAYRPNCAQVRALKIKALVCNGRNRHDDVSVTGSLQADGVRTFDRNREK